MIDKSDGRDWEKEAAEAVICLNCTKPKCNGSPECFRKQAKRRKAKKSEVKNEQIRKAAKV